MYSFVVADLFHYGHLQLLQTAKQQGDYHICGVLTDDAAASYRPRPIANFDERVAIVSQIRCVDRVIMQDGRNPSANLRKIHAEFPAAQLVLVHGNDWSDIPGREYVQSVGGLVVQPEYYRRLSDSKIRQELAGGAPGHYEQFTERFRTDNIVVFEPDQQLFVMSTKANTLRALRPLLKRSRIEPMVAFRVSDWTDDQNRLVALIRQELGNGRVVVRSSAINEDTYHQSHAGAFLSRVNVPVRRTAALVQAVEDVIGSYRGKGHHNPLNQVLVQPHTADVRASGVLFTRAPQTGAPYYVINFDDRSGSTESVTSGTEGQAIEVAHACPPTRWPREWRGLLRAVAEIERIIPGTPLDIEFAIDGRRRVTVFQVRPLACPEAARVDIRDVAHTLRRESSRVARAMRRVRHLAGSAAYSDMAFWNPAEIIGDRPRPLDDSLYRRLIMDSVWHEAIEPLGYAKITPAPLMVSFGAKPYVDLRCTFNALLPASLDRPLREKLVAYYFDLLTARPELHDKVEFEIADNCFYFSLDRRLKQMRRDGFRDRELAAYRAGLLEITSRALSRSAAIEQDVEDSALSLESSRCRASAAAGRGAGAWVATAISLLDEGQTYGTVPFTLMARLAFIGQRLLRSAVEQSWMTETEYDGFMDSVQTVATRMRDDDAAVARGVMTRAAFLGRYGHLRPGTYDITSSRYADDPGYFSVEGAAATSSHEAARTFRPREKLARVIERALDRERLTASAGDVFCFIRRAIEARERVKFEFTKNLSDALELIARAGTDLGFSRDDLAFLDVPALKGAANAQARAVRDLWRRTIDRNRERLEPELLLSMPPLIFTPRDLEVVRRPLVRPNFITQKALRGELVALDGEGIDRDSVRGKIVLLEKADPGFDWLFTKGIAGLVTKYGGVASHMAIRCGEFGLPAAIGCGDTIFQQLQRASAVMLDCRKGHLRPLV